MVSVLRRDHQAAADIGRAVTQLSPNYASGYKPFLAALGHLSGEQEAATALQRLRAIDPEITADGCLAAFPLRREADRAHFLTGLLARD